MSNKVEIGNRLREFGLSKFGKLSALATSLDMSPQSLQSYLSGRSLPGANIISKLKELGCDTDWLLLNKDQPEFDQPTEKVNNEINLMKDNIILSQAEEIFELKKILKELSAKINKLEKESLSMLKAVEIGENVREIKKIK